MRPKVNFRANIKIAIETTKKANLFGLLGSNSVTKLAPSYNSAMQFYLTQVLFFSHSDFSLKALTADVFLFVGIFCLNFFFKDVKRSYFLRISGFLYITSHLVLLFLLHHIQSIVKLPVIAIILMYTSYQSLLYEIFTLPVISAFIEICPPQLESFYMGMFFFINNASKNIGNVTGSFLTWLLEIRSENFDHLSTLILVNFAVLSIGYVVLLRSFVPDNKVENVKIRDKAYDVEMQNFEEIVAHYNGQIAYIDIAENYINGIYNQNSK